MDTSAASLAILADRNARRGRQPTPSARPNHSRRIVAATAYTQMPLAMSARLPSRL